MYFEFLIPRRPISHQTRRRANLQAWKKYVHDEAAKNWSGLPYSGEDIHLTLVYLCDEDPVDTDNIVEPIQDTLVGLVYDDDLRITDVESHRRPLHGIFEVARLSSVLLKGLTSGQECVYVRVLSAKPLEEYL